MPNHKDGFVQLVSWLRDQISADLTSIHVVLEATGVYHEAVAYALASEGVAISIVNPARVRDFAKGLGTQHKTDQKDSVILARFGALIRPDLWEPERPEIRELKALLARLSMLGKDQRREQNRQEQAVISDASQVVLASIEAMIAQLQREIERVKQQIDDHIDNYPDLKKDRELLLTIPAVGAAMRKLVQICYDVLKHQSEYQPQVAL